MPDCSICLELCERPAQLKLRCKCKYNVHFKCYKTWWDKKHNCILCKKRAHKPKPHKLTLNNFNKITSKIKLIYSRSITYITYRRHYRSLGITLVGARPRSRRTFRINKVILAFLFLLLWCCLYRVLRLTSWI